MLSIIFPRQSNVAIPLVTFLSATAEGGVSRQRLSSMQFSELMKRAFSARGLGLIRAWGAPQIRDEPAPLALNTIPDQTGT